MSALDVLPGDLYREASHDEFPAGRAHVPPLMLNTIIDAISLRRVYSNLVSGKDSLVDAPAASTHPPATPVSLQPHPSASNVRATRKNFDPTHSLYIG